MAGTAIGLTRLVRRLPVFLARGRSPFPGGATDPADQSEELAHRRAQARAALDAALSQWRASSKAERAACLPLAYNTEACRIKPGFFRRRGDVSVIWMALIWMDMFWMGVMWTDMIWADLIWVDLDG